ncbi:MAG: cyclic nucleotide-binding domain-containing protein [Opitutaceae bacterium]
MLKKFVSSVLQAKQTKKVKEQLETVLLSRVPFLKDVDPALIADMVTAIEPVKYSEGDTIFSEGEQGDSFYLIADGSVRVSSEGVFIAELGIGGCFGEGALIENEVRGATVVAAGDVTLFQLKRESFTELTEKYLKVRYRLRELHRQRKTERIENSIEHGLLKNAPFLAGAGGDLVSELAQHLETNNYAKGDVLIQEGDDDASFFLVEVGFVEVSKGGSRITELGPGACFGEGALFSRNPRSATVTALTDTSCFVLGKSGFDRIISRYPVFGKRIEEIHAERAN